MRTEVRTAAATLEEARYSYYCSSGCFDIAASRRDQLLLIKLLDNIDSLQESHATSLRTLSHSLQATVLVVGSHSRRERLQDGVCYERFHVPAMTAQTMEQFLFRKIQPALKSARGGLVIEIDAEQLRRRRHAKGWTQADLAAKSGITAKSIYEHERANKKAPTRLARRLERLLGPVTTPGAIAQEPMDIDIPAPLRTFAGAVSQDLQAIGFETRYVAQAPFNILAHHRELLVLSQAAERPQELQKHVEDLVGVAQLAKRPLLAVTAEEASLDIPSIQHAELKKTTARELRRLVRG